MSVEFPPCRFHSFVSFAGFAGEWLGSLIDDTDRLNFLQVYASAVHFHPDTETTTVIDNADGTVSAGTLRDAIDGAMRSVAELHGIVHPLAEG